MEKRRRRNNFSSNFLNNDFIEFIGKTFIGFFAVLIILSITCLFLYGVWELILIAIKGFTFGRLLKGIVSISIAGGVCFGVQES